MAKEQTRHDAAYAKISQLGIFGGAYMFVRVAAAVTASALSCLALGGCVSNLVKFYSPEVRTPLQAYPGGPRPPAETASLLMVTEKDVTYDNTIGWVRVMSIDGIDTSTAPNHHASILPGNHHLSLRCRPGPRYSGYKEHVWDAEVTVAPNRTYFFVPILRTGAVTYGSRGVSGEGACSFDVQSASGLNKYMAAF